MKLQKMTQFGCFKSLTKSPDLPLKLVTLYDISLETDPSLIYVAHVITWKLLFINLLKK